ncbi:hypothetical protein LINPERHAP2_LOCUS38078 [Linum perenne]
MAADLYAFTIIIFLSSFTKADHEMIRTPEAMDELIKNYTFKSLATMKGRVKTGEIYNVDLPEGIRANAARFRCGSLRRYGVQLDEFELGMGLTLKPCMVRVVVIAQNLGINWSSIYFANYDLSGYKLVSPILGLTAYDYNATSIDSSISRFSNSTSSYYHYHYHPFEIGIQSSESNPITIKFSSTSYNNITNISNSNPLCAIFAKDGTVSLNRPISISPRVCASRGDAHYGLVVKVPQPARERGKKLLKVVLGCSIGGIVFILLLVMVVICVMKSRKNVKMGKLERNADEGEYLPVSGYGNVRIPVAGFTRTVPTLEE